MSVAGVLLCYSPLLKAQQQHYHCSLFLTLKLHGSNRCRTVLLPRLPFRVSLSLSSARRPQNTWLATVSYNGQEADISSHDHEGDAALA